MKLLVFLLEPLKQARPSEVRECLNTLRTQNGSSWAIAEVVERLLSVTEAVLVVDARERAQKTN